MKITITPCILFLWLFAASCHFEENRRLKEALSLAGDNRSELEKILAHYADDPEKSKAARFLVENMPGHSGVTTADIKKLQPFYLQHAAISEKHNWERTSVWEKEIDEWWKMHKGEIFFPRMQQDIRTVRAKWLINEIDRSFKAWKENAYTRDMALDDFCRYILPYRFMERICMDNCRDVFYKRHAGWFGDRKKDFRDVTDSLNLLYKEVMHSNWAAASMPVYDVATFEQIKRGLCSDRAWFNCLLLSSLGMASSIDMVPSWGNRSGGHTWNSLVIDGETYPFEPFWDEDRWKYKRIYNNECFDLLWGKSRLPKVFRLSFEWNSDGPLEDRKADGNDVPALFRTPFLRDVSDQYFRTTDVHIEITEEKPEDARYCYLCVFGIPDWIPVQWGKIERDGSVTFKKMGRDIVYAPMFYENGKLLPAAPAFLLNRKGECEAIGCNGKRTEINIHTYTSFFDVKDVLKIKRDISRSILVASNDPEFETADTQYCITDSLDVWENEWHFPNAKKYRYVRLIPARDTIALCEISFYEKGFELPIRDIRIAVEGETLVEGETPDALIDGFSATGWKGKLKKGESILFDLGKERDIGKCFLAPYTPPYFPPEQDIELCYWDNRWVAFDTRENNGSLHLKFDGVPEGTLYRTRIKGYKDRIFMYKNGEIRWF